MTSCVSPARLGRRGNARRSAGSEGRFFLESESRESLRRDLEDRLDSGRLRGADTRGEFRRGRCAAREEPAEPTVLEEVARGLEHGPRGRARAEENRQKLLVVQSLGTLSQASSPWVFLPSVSPRGARLAALVLRSRRPPLQRVRQHRQHRRRARAETPVRERRERRRLGLISKTFAPPRAAIVASEDAGATTEDVPTTRKTALSAPPPRPPRRTRPRVASRRTRRRRAGAACRTAQRGGSVSNGASGPGVRSAAGAARLQDRAVQLDHVAAAGRAMQAVHVLRDERHARDHVLDPREGGVAGVRPRCAKLRAPPFVEPPDLLRVRGERLRRRQLHRSPTLPHAVGSAERREAAFGRDPRARQDRKRPARRGGPGTTARDRRGLPPSRRAPGAIRSSPRGVEGLGNREERVVRGGALSHDEVRDPPRDRLSRLGGLAAAAPFPRACPPAPTRPSTSRRARPTPAGRGASRARRPAPRRPRRGQGRGVRARRRRSARPARRRFRSTPLISVVTRATRPVVVRTSVHRASRRYFAVGRPSRRRPFPSGARRTETSRSVAAALPSVAGRPRKSAVKSSPVADAAMRSFGSRSVTSAPSEIATEALERGNDPCGSSQRARAPATFTRPAMPLVRSPAGVTLRVDSTTS